MTARFLLTCFLILATVQIGRCADAPKPAERTGTVEGVVIYRADPKRAWRYGRYYVDRKTGGLAETVVALVPDPSADRRTPSAGASEVVIDQKDFRFVPETVAIRAGDRVTFLNSDKETHNVRTDNPLHSFNRTMPAGGKHTETFARAGAFRWPYRIGCVYHSSMRAWVYVFDHPHFQVTGTGGRFRLTDVPAGAYRLELAHPAGALRSSRYVQVRAGKTTNIELQWTPDDRHVSSRAGPNEE